RAAYEQGRDRQRQELQVLERRSRLHSAVRLALAVPAIGLLAGVIWGGLGTWAWGAIAATIAVFVGVVLLHARVHEAEERARAALRFHERGLARLDHAWDKLPATSGRFRSADHPFANDLDVFGH